MFVHIIFSSFWVAEWLPFEKELLTRLTWFVLFVFRLFAILVISSFGFEGEIWGFDCFSSWSRHTCYLTYFSELSLQLANNKKIGTHFHLKIFKFTAGKIAVYMYVYCMRVKRNDILRLSYTSWVCKQS